MSFLRRDIPRLLRSLGIIFAWRAPPHQPRARYTQTPSESGYTGRPRTRFLIIAAAIVLTMPARGQMLPGGLTPEQLKAIPPGVLRSLPPDVLTRIPLSTLRRIPPDLLTNIPPDLLAKIPPNAATMTPDEAKAYYKSLDPAQRDAIRRQLEQMKARIEAVPGLMDKLKALVKSLLAS